MIYFSKILPNFCEADFTSFDESVYTRPVLVRGSTRVKISLVATVTVCSGSGYLNEVDGPGGCSSVNFT